MLKYILCLSTFTLLCYGCGPLMKATNNKRQEDFYWNNSFFSSIFSSPLLNLEMTLVTMIWIGSKIVTMWGFTEVLVIVILTQKKKWSLNIKVGAVGWQLTAMTRAWWHTGAGTPRDPNCSGSLHMAVDESILLFMLSAYK